MPLTRRYFLPRMTDPAITSDSTELAAALMVYYSFDLAGQPTGQIIQVWTHDYPATWLGTAVVEALYQGRYKAISVGQILQIWRRRGHPICHFNLEFETMVCTPVVTRHDQAGATHPLRGSEPKTIQEANLPQPFQANHLVNGPLNNGAVNRDHAADEANQADSCPEGGRHHAWVSHHFEKAERLVQAGSPESQSPKLSNVEAENAGNELLSGEQGMVKPGRFAKNSPLDGDKADTADTSVPGLPLSSAREGQPPIHRFMPHAKPSGFYTRLQAIASSNSASKAAEQAVDSLAQLSPDSSENFL